jgi:hypothetical protein
MNLDYKFGSFQNKQKGHSCDFDYAQSPMRASVTERSRSHHYLTPKSLALAIALSA